MPKNAYFFLEKSCKIAAAPGIRPRTTIGLRRLGALPPYSRFVFNTKYFKTPLSIHPA